MSKKRRILVNAIPMLNISTGIGRYIRSLYTALEQEYKDELEIGYFDGKVARPEQPPMRTDIGGWSKYLDLLWKLPPQVGFMIRLAMHLRRERAFKRVVKDFDLYHETSFFPLTSSPTPPVVFTVHDLSLMLHPTWHPRERVLFYNTFFQRRLKAVSQFISVSEFTKSQMMANLPIAESDIHPTPLAHDPNIFSPRSAEDIARVRKEYDLPERFFLFVGSGDPRKNAEMIPRALKRTGLKVPLVSVGWGGWNESDEDPLGLRHIVHTLGYVDDDTLACLYGAALALVFPSVYEGFGLPVVEAMACGCPVITTTKASLPEVGGDAALYLHDPKDEVELGCLMAKIAGDPDLEASLREKSLLRAQQFSWRKTAAQTFAVFEQALQTPKGSAKQL